MRFFLIILFSVLSIPSAQAAISSTGAKDMSNRLGVGYSNDFSIANLPSVSVKFYPSNDWALSAALGIDTQSAPANGNSNFGLGAKVYKTIFTETMLNFFMGAGVSLVSQGPASGATGSTNSGFDINAFGGVEFFVPGLENLGFDFIFGAGVTSLPTGVRFRTLGESPLNAGMFFYF